LRLAEACLLRFAGGRCLFVSARLIVATGNSGENGSLSFAKMGFNYYLRLLATAFHQLFLNIFAAGAELVLPEDGSPKCFEGRILRTSLCTS